MTLQSRCLCLPRGGPTRSLRGGHRQKELHLNMFRSRPRPLALTLFVSFGIVSRLVSAPAPRGQACPRRGSSNAVLVVALKATGRVTVSLSASSTGETG